MPQLSRHQQVQRVQAKLPRDADVSADTIIFEAEKAGVMWRDALALVEGESGFRNVFGHDKGGMFAGRRVTKWKVAFMVRLVRLGRTSNGVGVTQLTSLPFILDAQRRGGAHLPKHQLEVGLALLASLQRKHGRRDGFAAFNGGEGGMHDRGPQEYATQMMTRAQRWLTVMRGA